MTLPPNDVKRRLADPGDVQVGIFAALGDPVAAEITAGAGFDVVVIDAEHGPNDLRTVLAQVHAIAAAGVEAAVRVPDGDPAGIKRILDLGVRTVIVPMIETAEQTTAAVAAVRYPPEGVRGVASARAARWGRVPGYHAAASDDVCLVVQVESATGLAALDDICAVDGVDAVFIGPMDLAASMGHVGQGTHPDVVAVVVEALERIARAGVAPAVMAMTPDVAERYAAAGARLITVGVDTAVLAAATTELHDRMAAVIRR
jgi:4-hydroxy-2-oxoheptanedioate aldolase